MPRHLSGAIFILFHKFFKFDRIKFPSPADFIPRDFVFCRLFA
nr:MAG TPA: hypothetical protein [Caudoviricetes sp.]DAN81377.1 MAG TPA: hypothetical protein [Caudoviricetes sp.]DAY75137.1 MAG TPA: hypothetical protein [Caudoviricetes sp.]